MLFVDVEERVEKPAQGPTAMRLGAFDGFLRSRTPALRRRLAATAVFAGCTSSERARIARWGEVVEIGEGETVVREDKTDYWFLVVLTGGLALHEQGRLTGTVAPGNHFGELAIIGFWPQTATVTATEASVLFVLGRRHLLSAADTMPGVQRALFPDVKPTEYRAHVRRLHDEGGPSWARVASHWPSAGGPPTTPAPRPGRTLGWHELLVRLGAVDAPTPPPPRPTPAPPMVTRRSAAVLALVVLVLVGAVSVLYHPPVALVSAGAPIDVVDDIKVEGFAVERPTGRYLLVWVDVERPTAAGWALARLRGRRTVAAAAVSSPGVDGGTARRQGRRAYRDSRRRAITIATRVAGGRDARVTIRDRGLTGPSAGLVYALALADMLDPADLARGRTIAATGELLADGSVAGVGFLEVKAEGARRARADLLVVPKGYEAGARRSGTSVRGVQTLAGALRVLRNGRSASP